jgi:putative peptidoglycan lipid II flippase
MHKKNKLLNVSATVLCILGLSKFLNFIKYIIIGRFFGTSAGTDCFFVALSIPMLFNVFTESFLFFVFVPVLSEFIIFKQDTEVREFLEGTFGLVFIISIIIAILLGVFSFKVILFAAPGFSYANKILASRMLRALSLIIVFGSLTGLFRAINSTYKRYFISAVASLLETILVIGIIFFLAQRIQILGLVLAVLVGACLASLIQISPSIKKEKRFDLKLKFGHSHFVKEGKLFMMILSIWVIHHLIFVTMNALSSHFGIGSVSALYFGRTIAQVVTDCLAMTLLISIFPVLLSQVKTKDVLEFESTFFYALRMIMLIAVPVTIFLILNSSLVISAAFRGNAFSLASVKTTALALAYFSIGIFALCIDQLFLQCFIALKRLKEAVILTCSKTAIIVSLYFICAPFFGFAGLALAFSLGMILNIIISAFVLNKLIVLRGWLDFSRDLLKVAISVIPVFFIFKIGVPDSRDLQFQLIGYLLGSFVMGCFVYFLMLRLLREKEAMLSLNFIGLKSSS